VQNSVRNKRGMSKMQGRGYINECGKQPTS
jgi:hypothetical protein